MTGAMIVSWNAILVASYVKKGFAFVINWVGMSSPISVNQGVATKLLLHRSSAMTETKSNLMDAMIACTNVILFVKSALKESAPCAIMN